MEFLQIFANESVLKISGKKFAYVLKKFIFKKEKAVLNILLFFIENTNKEKCEFTKKMSKK